MRLKTTNLPFLDTHGAEEGRGRIQCYHAALLTHAEHAPWARGIRSEKGAQAALTAATLPFVQQLLLAVSGPLHLLSHGPAMREA